MRAHFDRFVDIWFGPDTLTPYLLRHSELACRIVPNIAFQDEEDPLDLSRSYLTCEDYNPVGARTLWTGSQNWDYGYGHGDLVSVVHGAPITHQVVRVEIRTWLTGGSYFRAHLAPLFDVTPSACSASYTTNYRWGLGGPGLNIVTQIGPTTWVDGPWTLQAEATGTIFPGCNSIWVLSNGIHTWRDTWDGFTSPNIFVSTDGGSPATAWVEAVP